MLKFLLIFFLVIYIVGYIGRYFFARWVRKITGQGQNNQDYKPKPEGEVTINKEPNNTNKSRIDDGEYIDYEEIKD